MQREHSVTARDEAIARLAPTLERLRQRIGPTPLFPNSTPPSSSSPSSIEGPTATTAVLTMIYVIDPCTEEVLLGHKARGFGQGNWNAFGGKVEATDVTIAAGARRELAEESGLHVASDDNMVQVATLFFEFQPKVDVRLMQVHVFIVEKSHCLGEVHETEEMNPIRWFPYTRVPLDKMWVDDAHWLPQLLSHCCGRVDRHNPDVVARPSQQYQPAGDDDALMGKFTFSALFYFLSMNQIAAFALEG